MSWRLARSLDVLRDEVNTEWPDRSKTSDGTIGDQAHANRTSAHNPNAAGVVRAFDITAPQGHEVAERIRLSRDRRIWLMISNRRICSSYHHADGPAWTWRPYSGTNPHTLHAHVEVRDDPDLYDDPTPWFEEDDMALTEAEQKALAFAGKLRAVVEDELGSNAGFPRYTIPLVRSLQDRMDGIVFADAMEAIAEELGSNPGAFREIIKHLRNHPGGGLSESDVRAIAAEVVAQTKLTP